MKKQINPSIKAQIIRSAFILLSLVAVCAIPFALAQRQAKRSTANPITKPNAAAMAQNTSSLDGTVRASKVRAPAATDLMRPPSLPRTSGVPLANTGVIGAHVLRIPPPPKAPQVVLYDQYNNGSTNATLSATFTDFPTFSADLADDFVVPSGQTWNVMSIDADGVYFNGPGPANNWNVFIYADNAGLPGAQVYSILNTTVTVVGTTYTVNLSPAAVLASGTYWIEIQANMTFVPNGEWGWTDRTVQSNSPAAWQNPGGGFGICPTWTNKLTCIPTAGGPDQVYRLNGTIVTSGPCAGYNFNLGTAMFVPGVTDIGNHCDDCNTTITLPFSVNLYDQTFTSAAANSNGSLQFGTPNPTFAITCSPFGVGGTTYAMGPYWTDQCTDNTGVCSTQCTGCGIFTTTTGVAPNRIFYIEYRTSYFFDNLLDYEIALYENGTPPFSYIYNTINPASAPNDSQLVVGVKKDDTTFTQYGCDTTGGQFPPVSSGQDLDAQCVQASPTPTPTPTPTSSPTCTPAWQTEPNMLTGRAFASGATANGNFYVLTGYDGVSPYVAATDYFNGTTWTKGAPIPVPHSQSHAAAVGTNIYVPGGYNSVSFGGPLNFMQIYDSVGNTWSNGMNLPIALSGPATAAFNGKVYIIGGFTTPFPTATSTVYIYDPVANSYTTGMSMPAPSGNIPGAVLGNEIFVVGGSSPTTVAFAYNPTTDTWRTITPPSPADCQAGGAFALNGQLWLVGCLGQDGTIAKVYDPTSDSWSTGPPLNTSQEGGSATSLYNALGFVAGGAAGGAASTTVEAVNSCATPTPTPTPSASPTCAPVSFHVLIVSSDLGVQPVMLHNQIAAEPGVTGVDYFDASVGTPTLAQLQMYNIVVNFSNSAYFDPVGMGNVLADYADAGGVVVAFVFDWFGAPFGLDGRWMTGGYTPFTYPAATSFSTSCLGTYDMTHPLMQNIPAGSLCAFYRLTPNLSSGAVSVAQYQDGLQLCAYKLNNGATGVGINAYPGDLADNWTGPFGTVVVNAGRWLLAPPCGTPSPTPTASPSATPTATATAPATATPTASPSATPTCPPGSNYVISQITQNIVPGTVDIGNHCDDCTTTIPLPFSYTLYDQTFTSVILSSNGVASFVTDVANFTNECLPSTSYPTYVIFPYWDDQYTVNTGYGIFTTVEGTAPNRIFDIEFRNQYFPGTGTANYELRLYEGQTRFDVVYGQVDNGNSSATAGVQKDSSNFAQYFCNGSGSPSTGAQSYILQGCVSPTPTPTATGTPSPTPTCPPGGLLVGSGMTTGFLPNGWEPTLAGNTVNYTFANSQTAPNQFALFDTHDPWGFMVIKNAITSSGHTYTEFTPADLAGFDFSQYQVVILNWDDTNAPDFVADYTAAIPALEAYINAGGVVWVTAAIQTCDTIPMPFGGQGTGCEFGDSDPVVDPSSPMMIGMPNPIPGSAASHLSFSTLPGAAHVVVLSSADNNPALYDLRPGGACVSPTPTATPTPTCVPGGLLIGDGLTIGYAPNNYTTLANNIVNYSFANGQPAPNDFALFDTHDPWGAMVVKTAITNAGHTYTEFTPAQLVGFNFSQYRVVILNWDDTNVSDFDPPYSSVIPQLEAYVNAGGVVWVQGAIQNGGGSSYPLPFGGTSSIDFSSSDPIVDPSSPMVAGVPSPITGNFASHVSDTGLPAGAHVVVVNGTDNNPVLYDLRPGGCVSPTPTASPSATATPTGSPSCTPSAWQLVANMPTDLYGAAGASDGTYFYAAGGYSFSSGNTLAVFNRFDPVANSWTPLPDMPQAAIMATAVYDPANNKIYVFGGEDAVSGTNYNITRIYDIASNSWSTGANMPDVRSFSAGGYVPAVQKIYIISGYNTGQVTSAQPNTWQYDPVANSWTDLTGTVPFPHPAGGMAFGVINNKLYIAGGRDAANTVINLNWEFDPAVPVYNAKADEPGTFQNNVPGSGAAQGLLWVFGGGNPFSGAGSVTATWRSRSVDVPANLQKSAFPWALVKGMKGPGVPSTSNAGRNYDPATDTWTNSANMNVLRSFPSGGAIGSSLIIAAGGYNGSTTVASAETEGICGGTPTPTPTATATFTPTPTATATATFTPTATATATATATSTPTPTNTPRPTPTARPQPSRRPPIGR